MKITFLGQGFKNSSSITVGSQLIKFLSLKDFQIFTAYSAFTSPSAIIGLSKHIINAKKSFRSITIITGIDKKGTSKEALEELLKLRIKSYVFHQRSSAIFHPKIYLFEGKKRSELIIGSSNLTSQGLFTNIETSLLVSIDNKIEAEARVITQLKEYFSEIFDISDPNLHRITKSLIKELVKQKVVPLESEREIVHDKEQIAERKETEKVLLKIFPKREVVKLPFDFRPKRKPVLKNRKSVSDLESVKLEQNKFGKLVWRRQKLPASSVQVSEIGTNPTGGLRLVQDKFVYNGEKIDQTTYFRNLLFGHFTWEKIKSNPFVEAAIIPFEITIKGKYIGKYKLEVRHKPSGEAGQHNYTTSISWGELGEIIRDEKLTGRRLDIYSPKGRIKAFKIVIH